MTRRLPTHYLALWLIATAILSIPATTWAACDCVTLPDLGRARDFPALGFDGVYVHLQGSAFAENGNIGVGPGGSLFLQGAAGIDGFVGYHPGTLHDLRGTGAAAGGITEMDMTGAIDDAKAAAIAFAAMAPTQTFDGITRNTTITGNGCINVIEVTDDIEIGGNTRIRLQGGSDDYFVFNVDGKVETSGRADIVLDGMEPDHVIFNITKPGANVKMGGGSGGNLTWLNVAGEVYLFGNAGGRGAYIAGATRLKFQGSADFYGMPFECTNPSCPDPELGGVNIQTPATPPSRATGNTPYFYSFFDTTTFEGHLESFKVIPSGVIKDKNGIDAVDSVTDKLKSTRTPFWDAGAELKTNFTRKIFTTVGGVRVPFNNTNVTETLLDLTAGELPSYPNYSGSGVDTTAELKDAVVKFVFGRDAFLEEGGDSTSMRSAVLGDIFHSNPLFIGSPTTTLAHEPGYSEFYASYQKRDRVVYAGANDGMFHGFDAGNWWSPVDPTKFNSGTGDERFGYVPGLLLSAVKLTTKTADEDGNRLAPGFVDGNSIATDAWLGNGSGNDITKSAAEWATVLIAAFREGGAGYIALDITDPDAGAGDAHGPYPTLLWEFTDAELGESWSKPIITRVRLERPSGSGDYCGVDDGELNCREQWVAIFGGGYHYKADPNLPEYVADPASPAWDNTSKALFMVDLKSGSVIASVKFDATGSTGPAAMKYAITSSPAVLDLDDDGFADVVYVGDLGGQLWKWDISNVGQDSDSDGDVDNWNVGVIFSAPVQNMGNGYYHYRQMHFPPSGAFAGGELHIAFGSGERIDLLYEGNSLLDDNNRFWVLRDPHPTGASAFSASYTESNLSDVTNAASYVDPGNRGYYFIADESEKFVTEVIAINGYLMMASFTPSPFPTCGPGDANFYTFKTRSAAGYWDTNGTAEAGDRRKKVGSGVPSNPRLSIATDPTDDVVFVTTSEGQVLSIEPPLRDGPQSSVIYWKQEF